MTGMHDDAQLPLLRRLSDAVHAEGAKIFAQLQHAGSRSRAPEVTPLAPSVVPNPQFGRTPVEATDAQIREVIAAFAEAAGHVKAAGFDGVHVHGGHGYLISEFLSPLSNRRTDEWAGASRTGSALASRSSGPCAARSGRTFLSPGRPACRTSSPVASAATRGWPRRSRSPPRAPTRLRVRPG